MDGEGLRIGSLFAGIGGLEKGLEMSGVGHTVWQVEMDAYCRDVLVKHWPDAERFKDVHYVGKENLAQVDLLCRGFPCQDISSAGAGKGLAGERSGLWFEFARIIEEIEPEWVVIENVASGADRWVDTVRKHMARIGYDSLPVHLSAKDVGAPHRRNRVFIIAHAISHPLRDWAEWKSWGPSFGVCAEGEAKSEHDGEEEDASYSDSERLEEWAGTGPANASQSRGERAGTCGATSDANSEGQPTMPRQREVAGTEAIARHGGRERGEPEPEFRRVDDGFRGWMDGPPVEPTIPVGDSRRIRALGNAVVPQCAEVIGWMIREMIQGNE